MKMVALSDALLGGLRPTADSWGIIEARLCVLCVKRAFPEMVNSPRLWQEDWFNLPVDSKFELIAVSYKNLRNVSLPSPFQMILTLLPGCHHASSLLHATMDRNC